MNDEGAEIDARAALDALTALADLGRTTLEMAVAEAPISTPEQAAYKDRAPGQLRRSGRLVFIVNETELDSQDAAAALVRELALARRLYRVDAEIRFETPYARNQHDNLHFKHEHGGRAKYLEHPIQVARPLLAARLTGAV
jgi:hypothetical protein